MSVRVLGVIATVMIATAVSAESPSDRDFDRAARNFRIQTYHQFRTNRSEYDARIAKGKAVAEAWLNVSNEDKQAIHDWFVSATPANETNAAAAESELPELPTVVADASHPDNWDLAGDSTPRNNSTTDIQTTGPSDNVPSDNVGIYDATDLPEYDMASAASEVANNTDVATTEPKGNFLSKFGNLIETAKKSAGFGEPATDVTEDENDNDLRFVNRTDELDQDGAEIPLMNGEFDVDELNLQIAAHNIRLNELQSQFVDYGSDLAFIANIVAQLSTLSTEQQQIRIDLAVVPTEFESEISPLFPLGDFASEILIRLADFENDPTAFEFEGSQEEFIDQVRQLQNLTASFIN